jgi:hypothetical protein
MTMSTSDEKPGDPEAIRRELAAMRRAVARSGGKPQNVEALLGRLAAMRNAIPGIDDVAAKRSRGDGRASFAGTVEDFDTFTLIEAVETFAGDVSAYADRKRQELHEWALRIYYTAGELARDPANADLIPQLETMCRAYERDYGRPIPPQSTPEGDRE